MNRRKMIYASITAMTVESGCNLSWDSSQFNNASTMIENLLRTFGKVTDESVHWRTESSKWRDSLEELENQLKGYKYNTIADQVRILGASFSHDIGDQPKAAIDYLEAKLKGILSAFREALDQAKRDIELAKSQRDKAALSKALDNFSNLQIFLDPVVTAFIPGDVELVWKDSAQTKYEVKIPLIEVRGWGFERPHNDNSRFSIEVVDSKMSKLRELPASAIFPTSRYLMQIKLETKGLEFDKADHGLVFKMGPAQSDQRFLPVIHKIPEMPPPPPVDKIVSIILYIGTTWDDKDKEIAYHYNIQKRQEDNNFIEVGRSGSVGSGDVWPDPANVKPHWRHFTITLDPSSQIVEADRFKHRLHVKYESSNGDPKHNCRFKAVGVFASGRAIPVLAETADYDFGHGNPNDRTFDFNL